MSGLETLRDELDRLRERRDELDALIEAHEQAIDALEAVGGASVEATVRASVTTRTATRAGARREAEIDKQISDYIRGAGSGNVESVRALMRSVKTLSQRDIASNLDLNPANVSKAVRALELMGELRLTGEKAGRSLIWTTQGTRRRRTTSEAW